MIIREKFDQKLLVEGNDDQHVIWALCEKYKVLETFDIVDSNGIDNLFLQLPIRFKQFGVRSIGMIIDADVNISDRWVMIQGILQKNGFSSGISNKQKGLIAANGNGFKIGVWIMPNNLINGMLEDFIKFLIPEEDALIPIVNTTLENVAASGFQKYSSAHKSKAFIHACLVSASGRSRNSNGSSCYQEISNKSY